MLASFLLCGVANAAVKIKYVSTTGNDANNGLTAASAYATINQAVNNPPILLAGDVYVIEILPGFYNQNVSVPAGWPSTVTACSVAPGAVKLVLKGNNVKLVNANPLLFSPTNPLTQTRLDETIIQQVSGGAGITVGEMSDVEILGLSIRNTNNRAIHYDATETPAYTCTPQFTDVNMANINPGKLRIEHNIIETVGTVLGNSAGTGIVNVVALQGEFAFRNNWVRDLVGVDPANTVSPLNSVALNVENCRPSSLGPVFLNKYKFNTFRANITNNFIQGANANFNPAQNTMTYGIRLANCQGPAGVNDDMTDANSIWVKRNRIVGARNAGIHVLAINGESVRNHMIGYNSIEGCNTSGNGERGGVVVTIDTENAVNPNFRVWVDNNVFEKNNVAAIVYRGAQSFATRLFMANYNIFLGNTSVGIHHINTGTIPAPANPLDLGSPLDAAGNWWGSSAGPDHIIPVGDFNTAPGNQQVVTNGLNETSVFYSPWLANSPYNAGGNPDDMMDDKTAPFDTASWGFQNIKPKEYIAKELHQFPWDAANPEPNPVLSPEPKMLPSVAVSGDGIEGYITLAVDLAKDGDTITVRAGTYQENVLLDKALYVRGPQAGVSPTCNSMRTINNNTNNMGWGMEAKVIKGNFGRPAASQAGPLFSLTNKMTTIDGLAFYVYTAQAISNELTPTNVNINIKNNIITTIDEAAGQAVQPGNGAGNSSESYAFVDVKEHSLPGKLWIDDNKFQRIIGRFDPGTDPNASIVTGAAVNVERTNTPVWIRRNYIEGDANVFNPPTQFPLSFGVIINAVNPTGADSVWVTNNYVFRSDNSGIRIIDSQTRNVNNIVVRRNTINQCNLGEVNLGNVPFNGGIEAALRNMGSNNIWITWNHLRDNRNASVLARRNTVATYATPMNFRVNYNVFNYQSGFVFAPFSGITTDFTSGNINGLANWWNSEDGPLHNFNPSANAIAASAVPANSDRVHYSPWLAGNSLTPIAVPDDVPDHDPTFDVATQTVTNNTMLDCATWGYQDIQEKIYYVKISSPGTAKCQPQNAIWYAKEGDYVDIRDVNAFEFEDITVNKNLTFQGDFNKDTKLRDITVTNGKLLRFNSNYISRDIYLNCLRMANQSCDMNMFVVGNGNIKTYTTPFTLNTLTFTGRVCEAPGKYVQGRLKTTRNVPAFASNDFGGSSFILGPGVDNLGNVEVIRIAGEETNASQYMLPNMMVPSVHRRWLITTQNPYTTGTRNWTAYWYENEDNGNEVIKSRPWNRADMLTDAPYTGIQPATAFIDPTSARRIDAPLISALNHQLTVAENECNVTATLSAATPSTICAGESVNFTVVLTGQGPFEVTYTENGANPTTVIVPNPGSSTITITPNPVGPQDRVYKITQVKDISGCVERANLGVQQRVLVRPAPTAQIIGDPLPICRNESASYSIFFGGVGPWMFTYQVKLNGSPVTAPMTATANFTPFTLTVPAPENTTSANIAYTVEILNVYYANSTCTTTTIVGNPRTLTVKPAPTASFQGATLYEACPGQPVTFDVLLTGGKGPWFVEYTMNSPSINNAKFQVGPLGSNQDPTAVVRQFTIVPPQVPNENVTITLTRVTDGNGCSATPAGPIPTVTVRVRPAPTARFIDLNNINVCSSTPSVGLPVEVCGNGPFTVSYRENGVDKQAVVGVVSTGGCQTVNINVTPMMMGVNTYIITGVADGVGCSSSAFSGPKTVTVNALPTAGFVGNATVTVCNGATAFIPTEFTGKGPWTVTYNGPMGSKTWTVGTSTSPSPFTTNLELPNPQPGVYTLTTVMDGNTPSCMGTIIGGSRTVEVRALPTASLLTPSATVCAGQSVDLQVFVTGQGPWTIGYTVNGIEQAVPAIVGAATSPTTGFFTSFKWTAPNNAAGVYTLGLSTVADGTSPNVTCKNTAAGVTAVITVNAAPTIAFDVPTLSACTNNAVNLPVTATGKGPWFVTVTATPGGVQTYLVGNSSSSSPSKFNIQVFPSQSTKYCVTAVSDGNFPQCTNTSINSCIDVTVNPAPTAAISGLAQPNVICATGTTMIPVTFTGAGPWNLEYRENNDPSKTVTGITANPYMLPVTPSVTNGQVIISLVSVSYSSGCTSLSVSGTATVSVRPQPTVDFGSGFQNPTLCAGVNSIGVVTSGVGPWRVYYTVNGNPMMATVGTSGSPSPFVTTIPVNMATSGQVCLTKVDGAINDPNANCTNDFADKCVNVNVLIAPSATFTQSTINTCSGSGNITIPVLLTGTGPWTLNYTAGQNSFSTPLGSIGQVGPITLNLVVPAPAANTTYTPVSVLDQTINGCPGTVSGVTNVITNATPTANLATSTASGCVGSTVNLTVSLTGNGPWVVNYSVNGVAQPAVTLNNAISTIAVQPTVVGPNIVMITGVSYVGGGCAVTAPSANITGMATVTGVNAPSAMLTTPSIAICSGQTASVPFMVSNATGVATLAYSVNNGPSSTMAVTNGAGNITLPNLTPGTYNVMLTSITDGSACGSGLISGMTTITVSAGASATLAGGNASVCLGQAASFNVNFGGIAPWSLTYTVNGVPTTVNNITTNPYVLTFTPGAAGTFNIALTGVSSAGATCPGNAASGTATVTAFRATDLELVVVKRDVGCNNGSDGFIDVTARISGVPVSGYEYSINGGAFQTSNLFTNLPAGTYNIVARQIGAPQSCGAATTVTITQPSQSVIASITNVTTNSATVIWTPSSGSGTTFYELQYRVVGSTEWITVSTNLISTVQTLTGLMNNTQYEVRVRTRCNGNVFSNWSTATFTTNAAPGCAVPGGIFVSNINAANGTATLNWNAVPGAMAYIIQYGPISLPTSQWTQVVVPAGNPSFVMAGLAAPNCVFGVRVQTNCSAMSATSGVRSGFSATFTFNVPNPGCREGVEVAEAVTDLKVYPNPNNGQFNVIFSGATAGEATLRMIDMTGRVIFTQSYATQAGENTLPVELNGYSAGVYMLQFTQGDFSETIRVVLN